MGNANVSYCACEPLAPCCYDEQPISSDAQLAYCDENETEEVAKLSVPALHDCEVPGIGNGMSVQRREPVYAANIELVSASEWIVVL